MQHQSMRDTIVAVGLVALVFSLLTSGLTYVVSWFRAFNERRWRREEERLKAKRLKEEKLKQERAEIWRRPENDEYPGSD